MSEVQIFNHDQFGVHTVRSDGDGNAVFVLKPVAEALGYRDAANAVRVLDRDEYWTEVIDLPTPVVSTSQVRRRMTVVTESGLYHLIFASTKPEAKAFRRWVTEELLPTVRKAQEVGIDTVQELRARIVDVEAERDMADMEAKSAANQLSTAYRFGWFAGRKSSHYDRYGYDPYKGGRRFKVLPKQAGYLDKL